MYMHHLCLIVTYIAQRLVFPNMRIMQHGSSKILNLPGKMATELGQNSCQYLGEKIPSNSIGSMLGKLSSTSKTACDKYRVLHNPCDR